jgi:phage shock protein A
MKLRTWFDGIFGTLLAPAADPRTKAPAVSGGDERAALLRIEQSLTQLAGARARLEAQAEAARRRMELLEEQARMHLRAGRDDPARLALQWREAVVVQAQALAAQLAALQHEEAKLATLEQQFKTSMAARVVRAEIAAAQHTAVEAQIQVNEIRIEGLLDRPSDVTRAEPALVAAESRVEDMRARAAALERLINQGTIGGVPEEATPPALSAEGSAAIEERLAAIRAEVERQPDADSGSAFEQHSP